MGESVVAGFNLENGPTLRRAVFPSRVALLSPRAAWYQMILTKVKSVTEPLPLDTVLSEFSEEYEAWVLQSQRNGQYLVVPDQRFPGRHPIRFFMSEAGAERFLAIVLEDQPKFSPAQIRPVQVKLLTALRSIAADKTSGHADSFVVHSPNEVFEFVRGRLQ
jgi:hypothetical protein